MIKYTLYWCLTAGSWCGQIPLVPDLTFDECNDLLEDLIERSPPGLHVRGECKEKLTAFVFPSLEEPAENSGSVSRHGSHDRPGI